MRSHFAGTKCQPKNDYPPGQAWGNARDRSGGYQNNRDICQWCGKWGQTARFCFQLKTHADAQQKIL